MNSNFFLERKGFCWLALVAVILVFCYLGASSSQDDTQGQAAIEQALKDALPKEGDLTSGLPWKLESSNTILGTQIIVDQLWNADVGKYPNQKNYHIAVQIRYDKDRFTVEDFRADGLKLRPQAIWKAKIYEGLPGGYIIYYLDSMPMYQIWFWKSEDYYGSAEFDIHSQEPLSSQDDSFAFSECERLSKLVYERLPGGESASGSEYDELRNVLEGYGREPGLWGDKKNATKALDLNRGPEDARIGFPTNKLLYYMLPEIIAVEKMADQLDLECNEPLYESQKGILDLVRPLLPSFEDLLNLPFSNLKKLCDIVKETSSYKFENYVVPNVLEGVYKNYKAIGGGDTEEVKNAFASVGGYYTAKDALGFKDKSDEEFYKICEYWFKLRYECEKSQGEIQYFRDHKKEFVGKIIVEYNPTLTKIEDNIRDLQSKSSQESKMSIGS